MSKINISLNGTSYSIDETALSSAKELLKTYLSTVMNGSGATITFDGVDYSVSSTKLTAATNNFITHLGTLSGSGATIKVGETSYSVSSTKLADVVFGLQTSFGELESGESGGDNGGSEGGDDNGEDPVVPPVDPDEPGENPDEPEDPVTPPSADVFPPVITDPTYYTEGLSFADWDEYDREEVYVDGYTGTDVNVIIPSTYEGKQVAYVSTYAFSDNTSIETVYIPDSVYEMADGMFENCTSLKSVRMPEQFVSLGQNTFGNCSSLETVFFPGDEPSFDGYDTYSMFGEKYAQTTAFIVSDNSYNSWRYGTYRYAANIVKESVYQTNLANGLINFYIDGTEYYAPIGYTWGEWINSEYNTAGVYSDGSVKTSDSYTIVHPAIAEELSTSEKIFLGCDYMVLS